jgi:hypothetical protein
MGLAMAQARMGWTEQTLMCWFKSSGKMKYVSKYAVQVSNQSHLNAHG